MQTARTKNLMVPLSDEQHAQMKALAEAEDLTMSQLARRWLRDAWAAKGLPPPPASRPASKKKR